MKAPLYVRSLTDGERAQLQAGLRSPSSFTMRRCQMLLASDRGQKAQAIAAMVGCSDQTVRDVIRAFEQRGQDCLEARYGRCRTHQPVFDVRMTDQLKEMLHQSPRCFGKPTSRWTLELAAEVAFEKGLTPRRVSYECIRETLLRAGIRWKRAKQWITSPDPQYLLKKSGETGSSL
jgi:transposase